MSSPDEPIVMSTVSGTRQSTSGPSGSRAPTTELSVESLKAEVITLRLQVDELNVRLLYTRVAHQTEAQGRQSEAQMRHILQGGLDSIQMMYSQLMTGYKSQLSEHADEKAKLAENVQHADEIVASQKRLIEIYEAQDRQQQSASHLVESSPLLSQYNNHHYSSSYPTYLPPRRQDYNIDTTRLPSIHDLDYSIGSPLEPCHNDADVCTPVAEMENKAPILPSQPAPYPSTVELDIPELASTKSDENKRGLEDEGAKPNKKRRVK